MDGGSSSKDAILRSVLELQHYSSLPEQVQQIVMFWIATMTYVLKDTLKATGIFNNASCIFNCDETGISLSPPSPKVVHKVGAKSLCYLTGGSKTQITVLACVSAAGHAIPPFVFFDHQMLNLTKGEVPGTAYGLSQNRWVDMKLLCDWVFEHFFAYAPFSRLLLLHLDGHSSHYTVQSMC